MMAVLSVFEETRRTLMAGLRVCRDFVPFRPPPQEYQLKAAGAGKAMEERCASERPDDCKRQQIARAAAGLSSSCLGQFWKAEMGYFSRAPKP
jgi:hypothetical protein